MKIVFTFLRLAFLLLVSFLCPTQLFHGFVNLRVAPRKGSLLNLPKKAKCSTKFSKLATHQAYPQVYETTGTQLFSACIVNYFKINKNYF